VAVAVAVARTHECLNTQGPCQGDMLPCLAAAAKTGLKPGSGSGRVAVAVDVAVAVAVAGWQWQWQWMGGSVAGG
jgi:hypothetical protein